MYLNPVEERTMRFYEWEQRGRGWWLWDYPVDLEPPFAPFYFHGPGQRGRIDDGRSHTLFSFISAKIAGLFSGTPNKKGLPQPGHEYPMHPKSSDHSEALWEINFILPPSKNVGVDTVEQFLLIASSSGTLSFEIIGFPDRIVTQFVCRHSCLDWVQGQLHAYFPDAILSAKQDTLDSLWSGFGETAIVDFGLSEECMRPLFMPKRFEPDPLTGIISALEHIRAGELGMLQIIFQPTKRPWSGELVRSVSDGSGGSFFADAPDMHKLAAVKTESPLFSSIVRIAAQADTRAWAQTIAQGLMQGVQSATASSSNSLIPLSNEGYPIECHVQSVLKRWSYRSGMLMNSTELATLLHPPTAAIVSTKLRGSLRKTKAAPIMAKGHPCPLGINEHLGKSEAVSLGTEERLRHVHVLGATGTGKTTMLKRMMVADMESGGGIMVLDPHGDLIDELLSHVPDHRLKDVVVIDPADLEFPIGFNLLSAHSEIEKIILSSDLVALFRRFSTSWGDQMHSVMANAILAFLEHPTGGSLLELRRFLVEPAFRNGFLAEVNEPGVTYYWEHEFPMLRKDAISPIITRLDTFLRTKLIRNMMAQRDGIDIAHLVQQQKIILVKLAQGLIGKENSYLLGTLFVAKLNQVAQSRQAESAIKRSPFYLYIDEAQNFFTPSMEEILSGARKFGLGLVLAHQGLSQLKGDQTVGDALIANAGTRICFRVGDEDAKKLASGFSYFDAEDLQGLRVGEAIVRIGQITQDFNIITQMMREVAPEVSGKRREAILNHSRSTYARTRAEVEESIQFPEKRIPRALPQQARPVAKPEPDEFRPEDVPGPKSSEKPILAPPIPFEEIVPVNNEQTVFKVEEEEQRQHRYLQTFFKKIAEERGFKAVVEEPTDDKQGRVDVGLERNGTRYAIEISVTTLPDHEIGNIQKCLNSGYAVVFVTSPRPKHLDNIQSLAKGRFSGPELGKVHFLEPDALTQHLTGIASTEIYSEKRVKGYRVKVNYQPVAQHQQQLRQDAISKVMVNSIRREK